MDDGGCTRSAVEYVSDPADHCHLELCLCSMGIGNRRRRVSDQTHQRGCCVSSRLYLRRRGSSSWTAHGSPIGTASRDREPTRGEWWTCSKSCVDCQARWLRPAMV